MEKFKVTVETWDGVELDSKEFDTEKEANDYSTFEWGGSDQIIDITMIDKNGNRSILDDVDS